MSSSVVPAVVAVILFILVGALALLAEWRSAAGRWFGVLNFCLAATTGLGTGSIVTRWGQPARALWLGRAANGASALAFVALYLQLAAIARATPGITLGRLGRLVPLAVALSLGAGALAMTPLVVAGEVWSAAGYVPTFGPAVWPLAAMIAVLVGGTLALVAAIYRNGSPRQRREVAWIAAGVLVFDFAGLVLLALVLPRLGAPTLQWAPTSLAAGSM